MRIRHLLGLLASIVLPSTLAAQGGCPGLAAGSTVRLHLPAVTTYTLSQTLQPADSALLVPVDGGARMVRCGELERVQLRVGVRSRGAGLLKGAGIGLLIGSAVGAGVGYLAWEKDEDSDWEIFSRDEAALIGGVFLGGTGALVGGAIGFAAPGSRWQDVPVPARRGRVAGEGLRIAPAGDARVRVSYTLPF